MARGHVAHRAPAMATRQRGRRIADMGARYDVFSDGRMGRGMRSTVRLDRDVARAETRMGGAEARTRRRLGCRCGPCGTPLTRRRVVVAGVPRGLAEHTPRCERVGSDGMRA